MGGWVGRWVGGLPSVQGNDAADVVDEEKGFFLDVKGEESLWVGEWVSE